MARNCWSSPRASARPAKVRATRSAPPPRRRPSPAAPITSSSAGRSATPPTRALRHWASRRSSNPPSVPDALHALLGMGGLLAIAGTASESRKHVPWKAIGAGIALQLILAVLFLKVDFFKNLFLKINDALNVLERATQAGTGMVFGYLGGGPAPFAVTNDSAVFVLAFRALPLVLVISALSALLFYWRALPLVVRFISFLLVKTMKVGGVVGLSTAANVFVGMVEAPLFVKPYLAKVSRGELFAIMTGGMASIAGTVLFLYAAILGPVLPDSVAHLLIASIVSAPAALVISFLMV